jgi:hypothetical protein
MVEIRRVGILSVALMVGLVYTALGLIFGLIFACTMLFSVGSIVATVEDVPGLGSGGLVAAGISAICFPLLYGVMGFIAGAIFGLLYNIIAGIAGGIKVELQNPE